MNAAVSAARVARPDLDSELIGFLGELALGEHDGATETEFVWRGGAADRSGDGQRG